MKKDRPRLFLAGPSSGPSPEDASSHGNLHHRSSQEVTHEGRGDVLLTHEVSDVAPILIEDGKTVNDDNIGEPDMDRRSGVNTLRLNWR